MVSPFVCVTVLHTYCTVVVGGLYHTIDSCYACTGRIDHPRIPTFVSQTHLPAVCTSFLPFWHQPRASRLKNFTYFFGSFFRFCFFARFCSNSSSRALGHGCHGCFGYLYGDTCACVSFHASQRYHHIIIGSPGQVVAPGPAIYSSKYTCMLPASERNEDHRRLDAGT